MSCTIGLKVLINRPCQNISLDYYFRPVVALSWCFNLKVLTWVSICQSSLFPSDWVPLNVVLWIDHVTLFCCNLVAEGNLVHLTNRLVWFWFCDHCFRGNFMCQLGSVFQISSEMSLFSHSITSMEIVNLHWYIGVRRCDISRGAGRSSHGLPKFALEVFRKLHKSKILTFLYKISIDVS